MRDEFDGWRRGRAVVGDGLGSFVKGDRQVGGAIGRGRGGSGQPGRVEGGTPRKAV